MSSPEPHHIEWQYILRDEYPPNRFLVWTAHEGVVQKGVWIFEPYIPLKETAFEDEHGNPIAVSCWCPLEDSPNGPPAPPVIIPTTSQVLDWLETAGKSTAWLSSLLRMKEEEVRLCLENDFDPEDLATIAPYIAAWPAEP
ncbi:MAG: hypothetical protein JWO08_4723 [Verrucomicrobiaceae bacterium]|nr:hypothetical protein [Verrucomicrobiaceae bacterium]